MHFYAPDWERVFNSSVAGDAYEHIGHCWEYEGQVQLGGRLTVAADDQRPLEQRLVLAATFRWVEAVIVHMRVCPFSSSTHKAGLPIGSVGYPLCRGTTSEELYQAFWQEVENLL